jgi:hypothetical protein
MATSTAETRHRNAASDTRLPQSFVASAVELSHSVATWSSRSLVVLLAGGSVEGFTWPLLLHR